MAQDTRTRMPAEERREDVLEAAAVEFARRGLEGTTGEDIAARAGVSQPYVFRLFGTKKDLFLAALNRGFDEVEEIFRRGAERDPDHPLESMGEEYRALLQNRAKLLLQLQGYAACSDDDVRALVQRRYAGLVNLVRDLSGAHEAEIREFFAHGMLLTVAAAIDLLPHLNEDWVRCLLDI